jgi:hypothetical protein
MDTTLFSQLDDWQTFYSRAAKRIEAAFARPTWRPHAE